MNALTGTFRLVRLALRRDRIKLPVWILAITAAMAANIPAIVELYGSSLKQQITYAATTAPSLVSRLFGGPVGGPELGEIIMNETFLFTAIAIAFMSTLAVIRHTRQNEETGRSELIGSAVVGRNASLTAALLVTIGANVVLSTLLALVLIGNSLPAGQSIGAAASLGMVGVVFAFVAAITAQISESARGANGLAAAVLGVVFLLRGVGDSMGQLTADKLGVISAWPSWLSPLGWMQQIHPFTDGRWWILGLFAGLSVVLVAVAYYLNAIRDLGLGMIPARKGPATAPQSLLSPFGLAWRLQRGVLRGWAIGVLVMGATIGLVSKEFSGMLESNPELAEAIGQIGSGGDFNDLFFSSMFVIMGIGIAGYTVQVLQRMRSEEAGGQLEPVLSTNVSKPRWMLSHLACAFGGAALLFLLLGASSAATYILAVNTSWSEFWPLVGAAFAQLPATLVLAGLVVSLFGLLPKLVIALSWAAFAICFLMGQFGQILKLPQAVLNISPFTHTPAAPAEAITAAPILWLLGVATTLTMAGLILFRHRDLDVG